MGNEIEDYFDFNHKFGAADGLFLAAALTEYDGNTESIEDERYGKLIIEQYGWGYNGETASRSTPLETHQCSDIELGLETDIEAGEKFKLIENSVGVVSTWKKKFKCMEAEDIEIWGDFNSEAAQQIAIKFEMCRGDNCESPEDILSWLSGKYIVLLYR